MIGRHRALTLAVLLSLPLAAACDEDSVRFGPPGGLRIRGGVTVSNTCDYPEGTDLTGASCPSWPDVIFPMLVNRYACADSGCHLAPDDPWGVNMPPDDADASWEALADFDNSGRPYIELDGQATAYILCNIDPAASVVIGTLMPKGILMSSEDLATVGNWVVCGMQKTGGATGSGGSGGSN